MGTVRTFLRVSATTTTTAITERDEEGRRRIVCEYEGDELNLLLRTTTKSDRKRKEKTKK